MGSFFIISDVTCGGGSTTYQQPPQEEALQKNISLGYIHTYVYVKGFDALKLKVSMISCCVIFRSKKSHITSSYFTVCPAVLRNEYFDSSSTVL